MLHVQKYLLSRSLEDLQKQYKIKARIYPDRVVLNYDQIESPKHDPIVKECRGLILSLPDYKVLCRSFDRFFNLSEDPNKKKFDISKSIIQEKIDGSLMMVYHDNNKWCVASRSMAFAEGQTYMGNTYYETFLKALGDEPGKVFKNENKDLTHIFEMVSPETRVVAPHTHYNVYFLCTRCKETGEYGYIGIEHDRILLTKTYSFTNEDEILNSMKDLRPFDEGYVCRIDDWRVKIKNPSYLAIAHLRNNGRISTRRIALLVMNQDHEEYLLYFPEDRQFFDPFINAYWKMRGYVEGLWEATKHIDDKKTFAMLVKNTPVSGIVFNMKHGNLSISESIDKINNAGKLSLLECFMEHKPSFKNDEIYEVCDEKDDGKFIRS